MKILQVSSSDIGGGAERVACDLLGAYRKAGHQSYMAVGSKYGDHPSVHAMGDDGSWVVRLADSLVDLSGRRGLGRWLKWIRGPRPFLGNLRGREDFDWPGTYRLLDNLPSRPDLVQCHNLHGGYFDLRALPWLSEQLPVVLTLHDCWLLSGHCAHSLECGGWETGCGNCPDLTLYPPIIRDSTAYNWERKRKIYEACRVFVTCPSDWLMSRVRRSILAGSVVDARVIPHGVNLDIYHPGDRALSREKLNIPGSHRVLLFSGNGIRRNKWKDYPTVRSAFLQASERTGLPLVLLVLGEESDTESYGDSRISFVPFQEDPGLVAEYFRAADIYVHAARVESFGLTLVESMACGTPVVATDVGGIPEIVRDGETGFLVPAGDAPAMADSILALLGDERLRGELGRNAAEDARQRFDIKQQAQVYLDWYQRIVN